MFGGQQVVGILCSIVRTKLVALWIGPAGVGLFGIFNSTIDTIGGLSRLNIRQTAVRDMAAANEQSIWPIALSVRRIARWLGISGALLMLALSPWLAQISFGNRAAWSSFAWLSITIALIAVNNGEAAIFQGLRQFKRLTNCLIIGAIAGTILTIPLFYLWRIDSIVPSIIIFYLVTWVALGLNRQKIPSLEKEVTAKETLRMGERFMKLGLYMTLSEVAVSAINYIFLTYLNHSDDIEAAGIYNAGFTLVTRYAGLIFAAIAMEYFPRLASVSGKAKRESAFVANQSLISLSIIVPVACTFILVVKPVVQLLYSSQFIAVVPMVVLALVGTSFRAVSWCMGFVIVARGDGKTFLFTEVTSAAIALTLNIIGYKLAGFTGLGIAYTLWYILYWAMVAGVYFRKYSLRLDHRVNAMLVYSLTLMGSSAAITLWLSAWWAIPIALISWVVGAIQLKKS